MSWENLVRDTLRDENPELRDELLRSGKLEEYVTDTAQRIRTATAGVTDPTRRATAEEVAIAQVMEEINPPPVLEIGSPAQDAHDLLRQFYYGSGPVDE